MFKLSAIAGAVLFLMLHPVILYVGGAFLLLVASVYLTGIAMGKFKVPARIIRERKPAGRGKSRAHATRWSIEFM